MRFAQLVRSHDTMSRKKKRKLSVEQRSMYTPSAEANRHGALPSHNRDEAWIHVCAECMWFDRALKPATQGVYFRGSAPMSREHTQCT
jgi:hypothetical protein